ncbi:MCP four helix bundle domain-containing protein [Spirosoma sp.]|uniref:MCP four helix bundle domain-containing protein n=1 Tax=Spirosoma sp. TaxID=1899569 RepID=UPI002627BAC0|nr:MCP four helix bundle domain-containing protein [Spirosoma sp.]MCX6218624.1 MCP four helix bundle domain-containing protein [Spirosoma sp.]
MKWSFVLQQKLKAAGLLLSLMLVILYTATSLKNDVQDMERAVVTLYADRLQPAIELVHINESIYAKRLLIEDQFTNERPVSPAALAEQLKHYDQRINERISQFEKTKLTTSETRWLKAFNKKWKQGQGLEKSIQALLIAEQPSQARQVFYGPGALVFKHSVQALHELVQIQAETGQKSLKDAHRMAAGGSLNVTLLTAVSLLVGLVILALIHNARLIRQPVQPFHLN